MNVLIVGSGGREHAIAWKTRQSRLTGKLFCAPGNAGIAELAECVPIKPTDSEGLIRFAKANSVDLTIVGPEQPLTEGIVDRFGREGLKVFGPSGAAARLEGSKVFAKEFMKRHGIPTAKFRAFDRSKQRDIVRYVDSLTPPIVVKADGLAAGKGVVVCSSQAEALKVADAMLNQKVFGPAGDRLVIEEYLDGEEMSVFALTDGKDYVLLPAAQDHKRVLDGDRGKNTGGMGAYAPAPAGTQLLMEKIEQEIIGPTIEGMGREGTPYQACLYVGLMLTASGPKVLEYNCRLGDPETQVVLPLLEADVLELFLACSSGSMHGMSLNQRSGFAVCVVVAAGGYPDSYETGKPITGLDREFEEDVVIFHAGTRRQGGDVLSAGGRVLGVTALGQSLEETIEKSYRAVKGIRFDGAFFRSDIGQKGLRRLQQIRAMEVQ